MTISFALYSIHPGSNLNDCLAVFPFKMVNYEWLTKA
jgi:hypothetical protein